MTDCLFCKIVSGDIPAYKVYEDKNTIAFLDVFPKVKGHTLVISKKHKEFLYDLDEESAVALIKTLTKVSGAVAKYAQGVSILQRNGKASGQGVPHVHFHLLPRSENDGVSLDTWDGVTENKDRWNLEEVKKELQKLL